MRKIYCPYCGKPLSEYCNCEEEIESERMELIEELEERQEKSGFYTFQDLIAMYRSER